jgi:subfamily B ATP-binding cassette protein MsbA
MTEPVRDRHSEVTAARQRRRLLLRLVGEAIGPFWPVLLASLLCMAIVAAMTAASVVLMKPMVDKVFVERDGSLLWLVGGAVAGTFILKSLASYGQDVLLAYVGQSVITRMQARLFRHLISQDITLFQSRHSATLVSHFTYDCNAMRSSVSNALVGIGRDSLSVIFLVAVMIHQDWVLSMVALIVTPLTLLPLQALTKRMRRVSSGIQTEMGTLNATLSQSFQGIRIIKSFGMEAYESNRVERVVDRLLRLNLRGARAGAAVQPIIDAFGGLAVAAVIIYSGQRVIDGLTDPATFFVFIGAVVSAYQPVRALGKVMPNLQDGLAAAERVYALLDEQPVLIDRPGAMSLPREPASIEFESVGFAYEDGKEALDGVSFTAAAGKVTALVGPSGAGKSTIFSLIPRFYDPQSGAIRIGGVDVRDVTLASLRDALAIVGQDIMLFDDTILANIRYGRLSASDDEVYEAARAAAADAFIRDLPEGYETLVGERGLRLSGGQRQRLAIARALLKDAPILLLDEATSALDSESERLIHEALARLMQGRTTLVIAHHLSTIQHADAIHVMEHGKIVESGLHDDLLLRSGGLYAKLHALQFAGEIAG